MRGTQLLGVRAAILTRYLPMLALLYLVGVVDGLGQRAIRRACGGRESASVYHLIVKATTAPSVTTVVSTP
jgi:hypothetical protein